MVELVEWLEWCFFAYHIEYSISMVAWFLFFVEKTRSANRAASYGLPTASVNWLTYCAFQQGYPAIG